MEQESIITELYDKIVQEKDNSKRYNSTLKEFNELREKFDSRINEEQQNDLQKLFLLIEIMSSVENQDYFKEGFIKGIKLMTEVYNGKET